MKNLSVGRLGGFTLIELLVVVINNGILDGVSLQQYEKAVGKAILVESIRALKAITDAQEVTLLDIDVDPDGKYFRYNCTALGGAMVRTCIAAPKSLQDYPTIEFHLLNFGTESNRGKHWCQVNGRPTLDKPRGLCKAVGRLDPDYSSGNYYLIAQ